MLLGGARNLGKGGAVCALSPPCLRLETHTLLSGVPGLKGPPGGGGDAPLQERWEQGEGSRVPEETVSELGAHGGQ